MWHVFQNVYVSACLNLLKMHDQSTFNLSALGIKLFLFVYHYYYWIFSFNIFAIYTYYFYEVFGFLCFKSGFVIKGCLAKNFNAYISTYIKNKVHLK